MTDKELVKLKTEIRILMGKTREPEHSFTHGESVAKNALIIAKILGIEDKVDLNLLQVCCYLHDLPISMYRLTLVSHLIEQYLIRRHLPSILDRLNLENKDKEIIYGAIVRHPHSYPYHLLNRDKDLYTKVLQDADTLDLFSRKREVIFEKNRANFIEYREFGLISKLFFGFGRKHLSWFLNYPELALYTDKIYRADKI